MTYLILKSLHVLSVVLFLGNIITGVFWKFHGDRTGTLPARAQALEGIIRSDRWFTLPGVVAIIAAGVALAIYGHFPLLRTPWIMWTLVLFGISGIVFSVRVAPMQRQLKAMAENGTRGDFDYERYRALALRWEVWGAIALLTPVAGLALMVLKPS
ncbi:MAG TPA: DUF2269 family protein [Steroidobacteraceae bacterium]|nr:DUF2269 family protein [Steroidobacteraceae bacterium]